MESQSESHSSGLKSLLSGLRYQHLAAGLAGGVASTLVTHPFDLIKLRFAGIIVIMILLLHFTCMYMYCNVLST